MDRTLKRYPLLKADNELIQDQRPVENWRGPFPPSLATRFLLPT